MASKGDVIENARWRAYVGTGMRCTKCRTVIGSACESKTCDSPVHFTPPHENHSKRPLPAAREGGGE